ncbi:MAG: catalase, partial [Clostridia bacterium]|nr:catalase [Clostridia bacterium]
MNFFKHLATVTRHRRTVRRLCFKCGLIKQGLAHDLSKFSPAEFWAGVKYYQGNRSPQAREREVIGYSAAWLHHKGKNKHHFEYWTDYA